MASRRTCLHHPDSFCYVCGNFTLPKQSKKITDLIKKLYHMYFIMPLGDQDKYWAPHIVCNTCQTNLSQWSKGKRKSVGFGIPMVWREPQNHVNDCYFCLVNTKGHNAKTKHSIQYPCIPSALRPVPHSDEIPIPVYVEPQDENQVDDTTDISDCDDLDVDFDKDDKVPETFSQSELNDLVRDLYLSKDLSELLASRLNDKNVLDPDTRITFYRNREEEFLQYFAVDAKNSCVYCVNVGGLLAAMGLIGYLPNEWRLFIDSSKRSLKCVLLHNGNRYGAVPLAHSVTLKERYENVKLVLEYIKYEEHKWILCVDLKMVCFLLGQQHGYTKYPCFLCLWDSRAKSEHWIRKEWPKRETMDVGKANIIHEQLLDRDRIVFPPLHIKLGLMKQYVKALERESECFNYLRTTFPAVSEDKLKAGIFDGPQIRKLLKDPDFISSMGESEACAWRAFENVVHNFLGNRKHPDYMNMVDELLRSFQQLGCNMSIKVHFLHSHLDEFPPNLGDMSDEQGERFHQDIKTMEDRYQGRWDQHMMADYCWNIRRDCASSSHSRKSTKRKFLE